MIKQAEADAATAAAKNDIAALPLPTLREAFASVPSSTHDKTALAGVPTRPAGNCGDSRARHRISSAIQLPMPGKPSCRNSTALSGARR